MDLQESRLSILSLPAASQVQVRIGTEQYILPQAAETGVQAQTADDEELACCDFIWISEGIMSWRNK